MKKLIIVSVITTVSAEKGAITSLAYEINCPSDDELNVRRTIESTRNPSVLFDIFSQGKTKKEIAELKKIWPDVKEKIAKSDYLKVNFLSLEKCEEACETCMIHAIHQRDIEVLMTLKDLIATGRFSIMSFGDLCSN